MRRSAAILILVASLGVGLLTAPAGACPNCKDTVANTDTNGAADNAGDPEVRDDGFSPTSKAYNYSIYFMMGSIYLVMFSLGGMAFYYFRKHAPNINGV